MTYVISKPYEQQDAVIPSYAWRSFSCSLSLRSFIRSISWATAPTRMTFRGIPWFGCVCSHRTRSTWLFQQKVSSFQVSWDRRSSHKKNVFCSFVSGNLFKSLVWLTHRQYRELWCVWCELSGLGFFDKPIASLKCSICLKQRFE